MITDVRTVRGLIPDPLRRDLGEDGRFRTGHAPLIHGDEIDDLRTAGAGVRMHERRRGLSVVGCDDVERRVILIAALLVVQREVGELSA